MLFHRLAKETGWHILPKSAIIASDDVLAKRLCKRLGYQEFEVDARKLIADLGVAATGGKSRRAELRKIRFKKAARCFTKVKQLAVWSKKKVGIGIGVGIGIT